MPEGFGTASEIFQLATVIYCDDRKKVDAAIIFGETKPNTESLLDALANIRGRGFARQIGISAGYALGEEIVSPYEKIEAGLWARGVPTQETIIQFPLSKKFPPCTDAEGLENFQPLFHNQRR